MITLEDIEQAKALADLISQTKIDGMSKLVQLSFKLRDLTLDELKMCVDNEF